MRIRLGEAVASKVPGLGWKVDPGNRKDFLRLMDLLTEVEAKDVPLEEAAQKYGAVVDEDVEA